MSARVIVPMHAVTRARQRCPILAPLAHPELVALLKPIVHSGDIIPSCMVGQEFREGALPDGQRIVLNVKVDDDDPTALCVTTLLTEDMDLPAAEVGHPRKYGKARQ